MIMVELVLTKVSTIECSNKDEGVTKMAKKIDINISYKPEDVGKQVLNSRGKLVKVRKYHMTEEEMNKLKERFKKATKDVPQDIKDKAGPYFFNPYRAKGVYYAQIQSLYLMGANEWHSYSDVIKKMKEFASQVKLSRKEYGAIRKTNVWHEFANKPSSEGTVSGKDLFGRFNENMIFFQRLSKLHPYGYKLRQVRSAIDTKRISKEGFPNGVFYYRLSTYSTIEEALPIKDNDEYISLNKKGRKYGSRNKETKDNSLIESKSVSTNFRSLTEKSVL